LGGLDFADQPAWSTIKVPLLIAPMRQQSSAQPTTSMVAAITESDNAAAESIWEGLGDPATAAADVGKVLHEVGDPTVVESRKLRPRVHSLRSDRLVAEQSGDVSRGGGVRSA
jgi:hypothetical protein